MAKKATSTDTDTPDASQLGAEISTALTTADTTAAQRILELQRVRQARVSQLTRTAAALKAQYGANDPGVKAAEANVAAATLTAARISMAQRQAATPDPQVSAERLGAARPSLRRAASADVRFHCVSSGRHPRRTSRRMDLPTQTPTDISC